MVKMVLVPPRAARRTVKTEVVTCVSAHDIRDRAYGLFQERGREHGRDVEDWLLAEAELLGRVGHGMYVVRPNWTIERDFLETLPADVPPVAAC